MQHAAFEVVVVGELFKGDPESRLRELKAKIAVLADPVREGIRGRSRATVVIAAT
jgi:hypothetical protein